jgi:AraC family transcriptional regulator of adaptative response / DNA-3-methyladenine glycosylase II
MALTRQQMLKGMYSRDPAQNGRYLVAVTSTGIYCLPDCPARKPKADNVLFFVTESDARSAGFRACKRCRPDHFYAGVNGDGQILVALADEIRDAPERFAGISDLTRRAGIGATKLHRLFVAEFHESPLQYLIDARIQRACERLALNREAPGDVGFAVGFGSVGSFYQHFKARMFLTPAAYRDLSRAQSFVLALPRGYEGSGARALFGRHPGSIAESVRGDVLSKAVWLDGIAARLDLEISGNSVRGQVSADHPVSVVALREAHARAIKLLGLHWDPQWLLSAQRRSADFKTLTARAPGLRPACFGDPFETLCWAIVGQQVNVGFAAALRQRIIERVGTAVPGGLKAPPPPARLATLDAAELTAMQVSRAKARTLLESAGRLADGSLDLLRLPTRGVTELRRQLGRLWGVGPWTIEYLLLRGYGYRDVAPVGDSALRGALRRFFALEAPPDDATAARLMQRFAPHRSLATHHLWRSWTP